MEFDPIGAVETLYRDDLGGIPWLTAVMQAIQPLCDPRREGLHGGYFRCADAVTLVPEAPPVYLEYPDERRALFEEGMAGLGEDFTAATFSASRITRGSSVEGWQRISTVADGSLAAAGFVDALNIVAVEPDGAGCGIAQFRRDATALSRADGRLLRHIFRHFVAAHRMKRWRGGRDFPLHRADAVLDARGHVHHARGAAKEPGFQRILRAAVAGTEEARGQRRRKDPPGALEIWPSLVAGRWTLVDRFEADGRRFIAAVDNAPRGFGFEGLSPRERDVVVLAMRGHGNQTIGHDLGIAHATVKLLMTRAAFKLGARTRRVLLDRVKLRLAHT